MEEGAYTTSGTFIGGARKIEVSRLHFNTDLCWYLDNSFCYGFHKFYKTDIDIEALVVALFAITSASPRSPSFCTWYFR